MVVRMLVIGWLAVTMTGCAGLFGSKPGTIVPTSSKERYCPSAAAFDRVEETLNARVEAGHYLIPQVGDNACEVLAKVGEPYDRDRIQVASTRAENWYYRGASDVYLVSFEQRGGAWVVDAVSW